MKIGDVLRDRISGFMGVAVARTEWLNGCVRITLQPQQLHEGKPIDNQTFDIEQLEPVPGHQNFACAQRPTGGDRPSITRSPDPR